MSGGPCARTQRYGDPMPETVLELDSVTQRIESGGTVRGDQGPHA